MERQVALTMTSSTPHIAGRDTPPSEDDRTTRNCGGGETPFSPFFPAGPWGPCGPGGRLGRPRPVSPFSPLSPLSPLGPEQGDRQCDSQPVGHCERFSRPKSAHEHGQDPSFPAGTFVTNSGGGLDRNMRISHSEQASLQIDQQMGKGFVLSVGYLFLRAHKQIRPENLNVCPSAGLAND